MLEGLTAPVSITGRDPLITLSSSDSEAFTTAEAKISTGLQTAFEVGDALVQVRDNGWYKAQGFTTFEEYCLVRWQIGRSRAYQMIGASAINNQLRAALPSPSPSLSTNVDTGKNDLEAAGQMTIFEGTGGTPVPSLPATLPLPTNEAQVRPLTRVDASDRPAVWEDAARRAEAEGKPVTARHVTEAANQHFAAASEPAKAAPATPPLPGTSQVFPGKPSLDLFWEGPIYRTRHHHRDEDGNESDFLVEIKQSQLGWTIFINGESGGSSGYVRGAEQMAEQVIQERIASGKAESAA